MATRGAARTIFSIIFAFLILREGVSIGDILGLLCCFGGIALIISTFEPHVVSSTSFLRGQELTLYSQGMVNCYKAGDYHIFVIYIIPSMHFIH